MDGLKQRMTELTELMAEFRLSEATLEGEDWKICFRKTKRQKAVAPETSDLESLTTTDLAPAPAAPAVAAGMPVTSPMNGIYYTSPSPNAPPFVKEGEAVTAGQVVGLIEAMKVFNEIVAPVSGTVSRISAENGSLVQPGEALLYIV